MDLNQLHPAAGSVQNTKRVGRGQGSGTGKTCGKGHKGQKARSGNGKNVPGFEGGQMPTIRRLPKFGFVSRVGLTTADLPVSVLDAVDSKVHPVITVDVLIACNLVKRTTKRVKLYARGELKKAHHCVGVMATAGAKAIIEKSGGSIKDE